MSIGFAARFAGRCGGCGELFEAGAQVFYAPPDDVLTVEECCGDAAQTEPRATLSEVTPADKVMPRGKTAKDRCDLCFIVHAAGQESCE